MDGQANPETGSWAVFAAPRYAAPAAMFTIGIALHAFNAFIASTTMPSAALELDAAQLLSWATSAYLVASIVGGALAAALKAQLGARAVLLASSLAFIGGCLGFGLAESAVPVIVGRVFQGLGEGVVMALCYTLIPEMFPKALVPRIFALESVVWAMAAIGGPSVAGLVTEFVSWRAAVLMSVPASLVFMALVPLCVPAHTNGSAGRIAVPWFQLLLVAAGVFLLSIGGANIVAVLAFVVGAALLVASVVIDRRRPVRLFPVGAFDVRHPVGAGLLLVLMMSMAEAPTGVFTAFAGQKLWGLSVTASGFLSATVAIAWSATAIVVAHLPRWHARTHVYPAAPLLALGLAFYVLAVGAGSLIAAIAAQVLVGASFGFSWARLCEHVMDSAPAGERDFAAAALPTIQFAGLSIGAAAFGTVASWSGVEAGRAAPDIAAALLPVFVGAALLALSATYVGRRTV